MSVLERHPELVSSLKGVDVAVHGFQHLAYSGLTVAEQAEDLDAALDVVNTSRLAVRGFRAPYLRTDHNTLALLRSRGFLFDSSVPNYALPRGYRFASKLMELIQIRYGPVLERAIREPAGTGVVELPVSLPDDELLIDALGVRNPRMLFRIFEAMLASAKARSSMLVLQVHPERYHVFANALELVLQRASDEGAWKASLQGASCLDPATHPEGKDNFVERIRKPSDVRRAKRAIFGACSRSPPA